MTYVVGVDIAKYSHTCLIINHHGEVIFKSFDFDNNLKGFKTLGSILDSLDASCQIKIGFEATGNYGHNLKNFLIKSSYDFMEIHPVLINRFSKANSLRKTKTDKVDVSLICSYLNTVDYKSYSKESYHNTSFKSLVRSRDVLVKERSSQLVRLTNLLDSVFPEFKPFFKDSLKSATSQYILKNYTTPSRIKRMTRKSYKKMSSQLRRTISYAKFCQLKDLAANTVGTEDALSLFQIQSILELYNHLDKIIQDFDNLIKESFKNRNSSIQTIPGIGLISAATIYAEIGDINKFDHPDQLVAFFGLDPAFYQSGETEFTGRMVKRGSSLLRQLVMNCPQYSLMHNHKLYDFYLKKRDEGKPHRVALTHIAKKLMRIIYTLETKEIAFDFNQMK